MSTRYVHEKGALSIEELIKEIKRNPDFRRAGAIAIFIGVVRGETSKGEKVQSLEIEAYNEGANEVLSKICQDLKNRGGIVDAQIHHFVGEFGVGEDLVYVLVAGSHRKDVFPVLREAVERYKKEAPIFKKEHIITKEGVEKAYWVAETEEG
ncbi:molybdenum cofactor biosynthesis protein MoaE [Candidatus Bathyarchaeota archaeon]|nr:molybdenum cofactor biosynthesis protein MoaE [Candidatus Bathyarchaeota archaeon]MBS7636316.1 molybdenum cofactor biosynthesis protein MoaE [Candidatus Bathyarchaeota archaeon]